MESENVHDSINVDDLTSTNMGEGAAAVLTDVPEPRDAEKSLGAKPKTTTTSKQPSIVPECEIGDVYRKQIREQALLYMQLCAKNNIDLPQNTPTTFRFRDNEFSDVPSLIPLDVSRRPPSYFSSLQTMPTYNRPNTTTSSTEGMGKNSTLLQDREPTTQVDVDAIGQQLSKIQQTLAALDDGADRTHTQNHSTVAAANTFVRPNNTCFDQNSRWQPRSMGNPLARVTPSKITSKHTEHSFHQLESWMALNGYVSDDEKFNALKVFIEPETYDAVASLIYSPPINNKYDTLKSAIIKAFTDSETKNIHKLLSELQLGDRRPSQLLTEMFRLYKGPKDKIFRELFLARLPPNVRGILTSAPTLPGVEPMSIETLAQWADNIMEQTSSTLNINALSEKPSELSELKAQVNRLTKQLDKLLSHRSRSRSRSRNNEKNRSNSSSKNESDVCFFHERYGQGKHANTKCKPGCRLHKEWLAHKTPKKE